MTVVSYAKLRSPHSPHNPPTSPDPNLDVEFKAAPHSHQSPLIECTARRDIPAGEQLTITYIDSSLPTAERQDLLDKGYGFQCNCFMCVMPM